MQLGNDVSNFKNLKSITNFFRVKNFFKKKKRFELSRELQKCLKHFLLAHSSFVTHITQFLAYVHFIFDFRWYLINLSRIAYNGVLGCLKKESLISRMLVHDMENFRILSSKLNQ